MWPNILSIKRECLAYCFHLKGNDSLDVNTVFECSLISARGFLVSLQLYSYCCYVIISRRKGQRRRNHFNLRTLRPQGPCIGWGHMSVPKYVAIFRERERCLHVIRSPLWSVWLIYFVRLCGPSLHRPSSEQMVVFRRLNIGIRIGDKCFWWSMHKTGLNDGVSVLAYDCCMYPFIYAVCLQFKIWKSFQINSSVLTWS